jgi:hypothetical protein
MALGILVLNRRLKILSFVEMPRVRGWLVERDICSFVAYTLIYGTKLKKLTSQLLVIFSSGGRSLYQLTID